MEDLRGVAKIEHQQASAQGGTQGLVRIEHLAGSAEAALYPLRDDNCHDRGDEDDDEKKQQQGADMCGRRGENAFQRTALSSEHRNRNGDDHGKGENMREEGRF